jgi:dephospho-CoA kinase
MLSVGLTGNIASGKSTVARLFQSWGATVIDADRIVHALQRPGRPVFEAIVTRFGPTVVASDGTLDRGALGRRVFSSPEERAALEAIVHPAVAAERARRLEEARRHGDRIVVSDIPLLFEAMDPAGFDAVVLVDAPVPIRQGRLVADRRLTPDRAETMIAAQMPAEAKRSRATYVIDNDADLATLERRAREVFQALERRADQSGSA